MHHFNYVADELYCENVPVATIAGAVGTPFYLYSHATLSHHFKTFDQAFGKVPHLVCFALKANSNLAVISLLANLGGGADIVSGGELYRALKAGVSPDKVVYSGVGKRTDEIQDALRAGILMFNIESSQELLAINKTASRMKKKARIALRVNPDVDPGTHPYISTGLRKNKFGIDIRRSLKEYREARSLSHVEIVGVSCHIGSQITEVAPFVDALVKLKALIARLQTDGINIHYLDLGGGLGIRYDQEEPPHPFAYAEAIIKKMYGMNVKLILEPGRVIVGNAGVLVTSVLYTKNNGSRHFLIVDAGMNDLARPSLYGSYHAIWPVRDKYAGKKIKADVVGPICESGDFLAKDRELPDFAPGDLMTVMSAGAYGFSMSSNYNSRPRVAEVMVKGREFSVIRRRETCQSLVRGEKVPDFLQGSQVK
ncbi:MAG: diaminopimelate decarboxylase [Deltaproteobacteria bacterium]|nr:diaminopimelate decarboxylase [Deltaproteobacteria bacterium]